MPHGQGGLMDVVIHPDFAKNKWIYISYTVPENDAFETRISRAKLINNKLQDLQEHDLRPIQDQIKESILVLELYLIEKDISFFQLVNVVIEKTRKN